MYRDVIYQTQQFRFGLFTEGRPGLRPFVFTSFAVSIILLNKHRLIVLIFQISLPIQVPFGCYSSAISKERLQNITVARTGR